MNDMKDNNKNGKYYVQLSSQKRHIYDIWFHTVSISNNIHK